MKMKFSLPLAASVLMLTGVPLMAQATGTSHPEDMDDTRQLAPDASDSHYVPPSHKALDFPSHNRSHPLECSA